MLDLHSIRVNQKHELQTCQVLARVQSERNRERIVETVTR